jgi:hypothetical protein
VPQRGVCAHGLVSWQVVLDELADLDAAVRSDDPHGAASPGVTGA